MGDHSLAELKVVFLLCGICFVLGLFPLRLFFSTNCFPRHPPKRVVPQQVSYNGGDRALVHILLTKHEEDKGIGMNPVRSFQIFKEVSAITEYQRLSVLVFQFSSKSARLE